jgi:hypothetical protein
VLVKRLSTCVFTPQKRFSAARTGYFYDSVLRMILYDAGLFRNRVGPCGQGPGFGDPGPAYVKPILTFHFNVFALEDTPGRSCHWSVVPCRWLLADLARRQAQ